MVAVSTEFRVEAGRQSEFEKHMAQLALRVRHEEPGCRLFVFARSKHDPGLYVTLERYDDEDALSAHSHAEHTVQAVDGMMECLESPPRVALFEEVTESA